MGEVLPATSLPPDLIVFSPPPLSIVFFFQSFSSPAFLTSLLTQSSHLSLGLPRLILSSWRNSAALFGSLSSAILSTCPAHCNLLLTCLLSSSYTPFTLALLIRSETGFAPMRAFTLHQLIRINDLIRIKLNHLLEVVSHRFSLLLVLIASVDATGTRIKAEQIWRNQCQMLHSYLQCRMPVAFPLQKQCSVVNKILL